MIKGLTFIGTIHSPYKSKADAPSQGRDNICEIEILKEYEAGLKDIDGFSHLHIFYWLHESRGFTLSVNTPWDDKPHGLFATRSPHRINPIACAAVELVEKKQNILKVKGLDAIEGTPVLDIKPYIPKIDAKPEAQIGWLKEKDFLTPKIYEFKTECQWVEGKKGITKGIHKQDIEIGCPPEFGGEKEYWSPEHLFVASIEVCIMTTFIWLLEKNNLNIISYQSKAKGKAHMLKTDFVFSEIELKPVIEITTTRIKDKIHTLIIDAGKQCMVSQSLKCNVILRPLIKIID
ncbi:MAG: tRNA (N6-threonylcarbamoyladenosine(37)-N6)-methyltransferase TrmO [bacterium]